MSSESTHLHLDFRVAHRRYYDEDMHYALGES